MDEDEDMKTYHMHYIRGGVSVDGAVGAGEVDRAARNLVRMVEKGEVHSVSIHQVDTITEVRRNVTGMFIQGSTAPRVRPVGGRA